MGISEGNASSYDEVRLDSVGSLTPEISVMFSIDYQNTEIMYPLAPSDAAYLDEHRRRFLESLGRSKNDELGEGPMSGALLTFWFLEHLLNHSVLQGTLARLFTAVRTNLMKHKDIHSFIDELPGGNVVRKSVLRTALFSATKTGTASILLAFGGQSSNNPACMDDLADVYSLYQPLVKPLVASLDADLHRLSRHPDTKSFFLGREIDLSVWLSAPSSRPAGSFLAGAAVSFPIIGITGLLHYYVICKLLGKMPSELSQLFKGVTGHSQGIVLATVVAKSDTWESFFLGAKWAVELLFWMGYESQMSAPQSYLTPKHIDNSVQDGYGIPSHLLLVRGAARQQVEDWVATANKLLPKYERLYLSLINGPGNHVITGPPKSLLGLVSRLRETCAADGLDQSRIPYSKRKPVVAFQFLPVNSCFHSPYLHTTAALIAARMEASSHEDPTMSSLKAPLFYTETGADMRVVYNTEPNVTKLLIEAVTSKVVDWPKTLQIGGGKLPSHVITLGPGRFSDMVRQNVDGYGVRVIDAVKLEAVELGIMGAKAELFAQVLPDWSLSPIPWEERFKPRIVQSPNGTFSVETRLNRVIKAPPIFVAGMTPTTVPWDYVLAVTKAGYHIELAGGGYHDPEAFTSALEKLANSLPTARSITCNVIYADPKAIRFQIPLIRQLIGRGFPIEGLTIGAGIPSPEVAADYIQTIGIKHISFKPGSIRGIREVIEIARRHPKFPILLQWTGGRGGGHHSCEDFHDPILETYGEIRRHENIYLVVGSGFGDAQGIFPYLTGEWSVKFGRPAMPCDGVLLGSRMMVATDAHTSHGATKLLLQAPGVDDQEWEESYSRATTGGAVLTVTSEMGQPIHKLATRGVRLWKEMDDTIFSLPKAEQKLALLKRKPEIIDRLNADYSKPWFGRNAAGEPVDLEDMTYAEVLSRLVQLMYISHQRRWIDSSYREIVGEFLIQMFERLDCGVYKPSWLSEPWNLVQQTTRVCCNVTTELLHPEDVRRFILSCKTRGRKPVNFVVSLDGDFEHWFKKDSLWQSEDLDAVLDQDAGRTCILQSPMSVQYSTRDDQSAGEILHEIHGGLISMISGNETRETDRTARQLAMTPPLLVPGHIRIDDRESGTIVRPEPGEGVPSPEEWLECLQSYACRAILGLIREENMFEASSKRCRPNPFRRILGPQQGYSLLISRDRDEGFLRDDSTGETIVHVEAFPLGKIQVEFTHRDSVPSGPATLSLLYTYDENIGQLVNSTEDYNKRIRDFYARLWLGSSPTDRFQLTRQLQSSLNTAVSHAFVSATPPPQTDILPLEAAIIAGWDALMRPLLVCDLQGDMFRLVHQSIGIEYTTDSSTMQVGDSVTTESSIVSSEITPSGKSVAVKVLLWQENNHIATVNSAFFIKGAFTDHHNTFRRAEEPSIELKVESSIDEAVLLDRSWLHLEDTSTPLVGKTLLFQLSTLSQRVNETSNMKFETRGTVFEMLWNGTTRKLGYVAFDTAEGHGNPVVEFLQRKGKTFNGKVPLKSPGWNEKSKVLVTTPPQNQLYAQISGDCNPIHVSPVFSELAELPGPVTHGMYTAAVCRKVVENLVIPGEPERLRRFDASFVGIVRPGDKLVVGISHVAMKDGKMIFEVVARQQGSEEEVLRGEAEIAQSATAYLFTGQGSQSTGMGMALYDSSPVAKAIYDDSDKHLKDLYGWSILEIIKENPKIKTVHFRGKQGQKILRNYLGMETESVAENGHRSSVPILPGLSPSSTSYTFSESRGLLQATQFAQPAIILLEKAALEHMKANGLVQKGAAFAGHSLGEYGALSSMAGFVDFKDMLSIGFYRGLMMQYAIPRDSSGQTGYAMMAINPARAAKCMNCTIPARPILLQLTFPCTDLDGNALGALVQHIAEESGELLEIVNFNSESEQYVCAGYVQNLSCLTEVLNAVAQQGFQPRLIKEFLQTPERAATTLGNVITQMVAQSKDLPLNAELRRGTATIPLSGIDVPFHSKRLRSGIPTFRKLLRERVKPEDIRAEQLVGHFTPNLIGKPFSLDSAFIQEVISITQSPVLKDLKW
ncbi:putative SpofasB [Seiridium unicorne]|uniref:SpofasB n=1 Tax=Seiridium unicorne TaxID=138068 RepID=A0ABR2VBL1_9PEZI